MFDTIHTTSGCGQVKCFGCMLEDFRPGDRVTLHTTLTAEQHQALYDQLVEEHSRKGLSGSDLQIAIAGDPRSDALFAGEISEEREYDVRMTHGGGFVHVRGGIITGWDGTFDPSVAHFDSYGRPLGIVGVVGAEVEFSPEMCRECSGEA